jgi:hypothetical protein
LIARTLAACAALVLLLASCGGAQSPNDALAETSRNLAKIKSGDLSVDLLFTAKGGERAGFNLAGPFAFHGGALPEGQLDYTQIAGQKTASQTFIMKAGKAYVRVRGQTFELPPSMADQIKGTLGASGGLGVIDLSDWVRNPKISSGGEVGGADTDKISADLNVPAAVSGLLAAASAFGGSAPLPALSGASAEQVQRAVEKATVEIWTGKDDRLLRKLDVDIVFSPAEAPANVKRLVGATMHLELGVSNPNEKISVETPTNVQPYPSS